MENEVKTPEENQVRTKILVIRNQQVMLDRDLAELYGVQTKRLNEQVKRNIERFPEEFFFQLTREEVDFLVSQNIISTLMQSADLNFDTQNLKSQFATSSWGGTRKLPYAFTEQGVAMLSAVLKSETAVKASIQIMKAFVEMRHILTTNAQLFQRLDFIERRQIASDIHQKETDEKVQELFSLMDKYKIDETQGIFFQGQIFDAYAKFENFISQAKKEIILIDGYIDLSVLERLSKKQKSVDVTIYTDSKTKITEQDIQKFNAQYPNLTVKYTAKMHDRFLIIDGTILYHIGASLKDLGKKCFAFEILDSSLIPLILQNI